MFFYLVKIDLIVHFITMSDLRFTYGDVHKNFAIDLLLSYAEELNKIITASSGEAFDLTRVRRKEMEKKMKRR
jgi:hypothetical protein